LSLENTRSSKIVKQKKREREDADVVFSYIIESGVCYLCICDQSYPRKLAFSYLEELAKEFNMSYGSEVEKPGLRPYAFVKFGKQTSVM
jgi:vesicle transport protein SEC22